MLRIPLLEKLLGFLFLGFLVSRILGVLAFGFLVSKILGVLVSKILRFLVSKFQRFTKFSISCFLIDIGPISKILEILLNGSSGFVGARLFPHC